MIDDQCLPRLPNEMLTPLNPLGYLTGASAYFIRVKSAAGGYFTGGAPAQPGGDSTGAASSLYRFLAFFLISSTAYMLLLSK
jgi:hypothetical protein